MVKSRYNYIYKRKDSSYGICNTLKGSIAILTEVEKQIYDALPKTISSEDEFVRNLYNLGMLIDEDVDELAFVNACRFSKTYMRKDAYFRILTTTDCNARCDYCYESGIEHESMTDDVAKKVVNYIASQKGLEQIYIHWFGGEPLLNTRPIDIIMSGIKEQLASNIKVYTYFTSNCSILDDSIVEKLIEWNTTWFQVSIDGIGENYDRIKAYKDSKRYNFDNTIENIKRLLERGIVVNLCIKYWSEQLPFVFETIDYLKKDFQEYAKKGLLKISPSPLFKVPDLCNITEGIRHTLDTNLIRAKKYLEASDMTNGEDLFDLSFKEGQCYACTEGSLVISPTGKLYKCALAMKDKSMCIGDIDNGIEHNKYYFKWVTPILPDECIDCIFLPLCQGGCRAGYFGYAEFGCYRTEYDFDSVVEYKIQRLLQ